MSRYQAAVSLALGIVGVAGVCPSPFNSDVFDPKILHSLLSPELDGVDAGTNLQQHFLKIVLPNE